MTSSTSPESPSRASSGNASSLDLIRIRGRRGSGLSPRRPRFSHTQSVRDLPAALLAAAGQDNTGRGVEDQLRDLLAFVEVEEPEQAARLRVRGLATDAAEVPVILDKAQDGGLVGHLVVD